MEEQNKEPEKIPQDNSTSENSTDNGNPLEFSNRIDLSKLRDAVAKIKTEMGKVIIGQQDMIELLIISILADGHSLIEGVPGVAKTVTAKLLAKTINYYDINDYIYL